MVQYSEEIHMPVAVAAQWRSCDTAQVFRL